MPDIGPDDEAALINLRYALADAVEICRAISAQNRADANVIEQMIKSANLQVMLLMKLQQPGVGTPAPFAQALGGAADAPGVRRPGRGAAAAREVEAFADVDLVSG